MTQTTYTCRYISFLYIHLMPHAWVLKKKKRLHIDPFAEFWNLEQQKWEGIELMRLTNMCSSVCSVDKWNPQLLLFVSFASVFFLLFRLCNRHCATPLCLAYCCMCVLCVVFSIHLIFTSHSTYGDTIKSSSPSQTQTLKCIHEVAGASTAQRHIWLSGNEWDKWVNWLEGGFTHTHTSDFATENEPCI